MVILSESDVKGRRTEKHPSRPPRRPRVSPEQAAEEARLRVLTRFYLSENKISEEAFLETVGLAREHTVFNKWLNGATGSLGGVERIRAHLDKTGYFPLYGRGIVARLASRYWHTTTDENSDRVLTSYQGHYTCYQMSSWFPGAVTVSRLEIGPREGDPLSRRVTEQQHTGSKDKRDRLRDLVKEPVPDQHEGFEGFCFYATDAVSLFLRGTDGLLKTAICNVRDTDGIALSGRVLKQTRRRGQPYLHTTNLCLIGPSLEKGNISPHIALVEDIDNEAIRQRLKDKISPE